MDDGPKLYIDLRREDAPPGAPTMAQIWATAFASAGEAALYAGQALGVGLLRGVQAMTELLESLQPIDECRVPPGTVLVRPVGRRSNSREWLAYDVTRACWRPCERIKGAGWWWK